ncbi:MAG: Fic family protein, partial [Candidatus Cybelea sp.]
PRRARRACDYRAYLPDQLADRAFSVDGAVAADVAQAELAIARLDGRARALVDTEALARLLLRSESVASSWIEGIEVRPRRLLRVAAEQRLGEEPRDVTASEVLANVDAMQLGMESVREGTKLDVGLLLKMHQLLLSRTHMGAHAGRFRTAQNWIGGSGYNPCEATFVPPPPERVEPLMNDLCTFCNTDDLPTVAQAAIAHAQFETIHPFPDGNGRIGRALIQLILRRRGLSKRALAPISLILARSRENYFSTLRATAYTGRPDSANARESANAWIEFFAATALQAAREAHAFEQRIDKLEARWRKRLGRVRAASAVDLLLRRLPAAPVLTVPGVAEMTGRSFEAANNAVAVLVEAGVLKPITVARRNRAFEVPELITAFAEFERP